MGKKPIINRSSSKPCTVLDDDSTGPWLKIDDTGKVSIQSGEEGNTNNDRTNHYKGDPFTFQLKSDSFKTKDIQALKASLEDPKARVCQRNVWKLFAKTLPANSKGDKFLFRQANFYSKHLLIQTQELRPVSLWKMQSENYWLVRTYDRLQSESIAVQLKLRVIPRQNRRIKTPPASGSKTSRIKTTPPASGSKQHYKHRSNDDFTRFNVYIRWSVPPRMQHRQTIKA